MSRLLLRWIWRTLDCLHARRTLLWAVQVCCCVPCYICDVIRTLFIPFVCWMKYEPGHRCLLRLMIRTEKGVKFECELTHRPRKDRLLNVCRSSLWPLKQALGGHCPLHKCLVKVTLARRVEPIRASRQAHAELSTDYTGGALKQRYCFQLFRGP